MDPSDHDQNEPGNGATGGDNRPAHANLKPREDDRWLRSVVENSSEIVTIVDPDGTLRYANPAWERALGYDSDGAIGKMNVLDHVHPEDLGHVLEETEKTLGEGGVITNEAQYRFRHADGSWRWIESVGTYLLDDPEVGGVVVTSRDVTERNEAETRLREAEDRYRTLVEHIPAVTYIEEVGDTQSTLYTSPQIEGLLGYPQEEWLGDLDHWKECIHPEDRERVLAEDDRSNLTGEPFRSEYRLIHRDGHVVWVHDEAVLVERPGEGGRIWQGVMTDVTERKALEERLEHQALHDSLTNLPNRRLLMDRLGHALKRSRRQQNRVAVLFMDLDEFKVVNDSLGHEVGDLLLTVVAQRLRRCLRPEDTLARFGGDEFVVLIEAIDDPVTAVQVAERITGELRRPFIMGGRELYATASIGLSLGHARTHEPDGLLREADTAMYRAKGEGGTFMVFDSTMYERALGRLEVEHDLRRAIEQDEFVVHYQPIVDLQTGAVWGMEALVRWDHPERGLLDPDEFVPVAEESGLVVSMGEQVLEQACYRAVEWQRQFPRTPPLVMCVNLSARQLSRPDLAETVERVLGETGLKGSHLTLDVTETVYIKALEANTAILDRLRAMGVRFSIDDFGTGYSSLSYLKCLPADALKIDKSFVKGLGEDIEDTAIVRMIIELAHTLGIEIIAEGVESKGQAVQLKEMGCDMGQGYHFAKPLPP